MRTKRGQCCGAGDEVAELGHHLAAVADADGEGVGAGEEGGEGVAELRVEEDGFGPAAAGAEDVAVGEAAAGGEADEAGEVGAAGEEVAHGDVDAFEAGAVEGGGGFVLAVDALLAEDGDAGAGEVKVRSTNAFGEIEGDVDEEAGAVGVVEEGEFCCGAGGVVAERGDVEGGLGPDLVEGGAGVAVDSAGRCGGR